MRRQTLALGRVVVASAGDELTVLPQRLLDRPMAAGLITELEQFPELAKQCQLKEIYEALWTSVGREGGGGK